MRIAERQELLRSGLIDRRPIVCAVCGKVIQPGDQVMCNDGYERIYGEFVLGEVDEVHEDNWPEAHAVCAGADKP